MNLRIPVQSFPATDYGRNSPFLLLLSIVLALLLVLAISSGEFLLLGFVLVIPMTVMLAIFPKALLWITIIGGLVIGGVLELYLPQLQYLRWAFAGAAILFPVSVLIRNFMSTARRLQMPALCYWALAFLILGVFTTILNWKDIGLIVFGWKGYFQVWGLLPGLAFLSFSPELLRSLTKAFLYIGFIQLPFALHQFLFLVPLRRGMGHNIVPVDVVAGTFGASITGGGANSLLAVFLIFVAAGLVAMWQSGELCGKWVLPIMPLLLGPIFLNESKMSVIYLVAVFFVLFRREIVTKPIRFITMSVAVVALIWGLIFSYAVVIEDSRVKTTSEVILEAYISNTAEGKTWGKYQLNRITALHFWEKERRKNDFLRVLFGHGLGEARDSSEGALKMVHTLAGTSYVGMGIGITSITSLLWETGVIGLMIILGMFVSAIRLAGRLAKLFRNSPFYAGLFNGIQVGVVLLALSLAHNNMFVFQFQYQVLVMLLLGCLVYAARHRDKIGMPDPGVYAKDGF